MVIETAVEEAIEAVYARLEEVHDLAQLNEAEQTILLVHGAQGVIDNGGLQFFFENDWSGQPSYSAFVEALRRIGAWQAADRLERAASMFPFKEPHRDQVARRRFLESLSAGHEFERLSMQASQDAGVWSNLAAFVRRHKAEIVPSGRTRG
jgi:hypothetical protein